MLSIFQIVPGGSAYRSGFVNIDDLILQIDGQHVTSIQEAKMLILGDEGTKVRLGIFRQGKGEFTVDITRGGVVTGMPGGAFGGGTSTSSSVPTMSTDPGTWSVKELKQALSEAGVFAGGATEKDDLVRLARDNNVPPPGTKRPQSSSSAGMEAMLLC
jgi:hypothetical protein